MSTELRLVIDLAPKTKKNSQNIHRKMDGTPFVAPSRAFRDYQHFALPLLRRYGEPRIDYPINLQCIYYMGARYRVDLVNLLEATCDVLVHAGILKDDNCNIVVSHDGSRVRYDKNHPRTEIIITKAREPSWRS